MEGLTIVRCGLKCSVSEQHLDLINKLMSVLQKFCLNIVKVAVDLQSTLTML